MNAPRSTSLAVRNPLTALPSVAAIAALPPDAKVALAEWEQT